MAFGKGLIIPKRSEDDYQQIVWIADRMQQDERIISNTESSFLLLKTIKDNSLESSSRKPPSRGCGRFHEDTINTKPKVACRAKDFSLKADFVFLKCFALFEYHTKHSTKVNKDALSIIQAIGDSSLEAFSDASLKVYKSNDFGHFPMPKTNLVILRESNK